MTHTEANIETAASVLRDAARTYEYPNVDAFLDDVLDLALDALKEACWQLSIPWGLDLFYAASAEVRDTE